MPSTEEISVTWLSGTAKGSTDHFPHAVFANAGRARHHKHRVTRGNWQNWAWFDVSIDGRIAILDYRPYPRVNTKNLMALGQLRIVFADSARTTIQTYEWMGIRARRYQRVKFDRRVISAPDLGKYRPATKMQARKERAVKQRPGQVVFKNRLLFAYRGRCCITGCDVTEALDGAHIDPFLNASHDHPANGLLLRKDLHALFDQDLLAIAPGRGTVVFAAECLTHPPYRQLHKSAVVASPDRGFEAYRPDPSALRRRWQRFQAVHGSGRAK